ALIESIRAAEQVRVLQCGDKLLESYRRKLLDQLSQIDSELLFWLFREIILNNKTLIAKPLELEILNSNSSRVFISYAEKDKRMACKLHADLLLAKIDVFAAFDQIIAGESFVTRINEGLKWSNTLVLLWSKYAANSHWVSKEWETALVKNKRIIPCLLDGTPLPEVLSPFMYITFTNYEEEYPKLYKALCVTQAESNSIFTD
ncbi:toll/interleukin-1 receptor domain-containing protein, partial [bacterium]|nr:toll/interleukin-1 receptor domain-containing protein [bacterium]